MSFKLFDIYISEVIELIYLKYMKAMISYDNVTRVDVIKRRKEKHNPDGTGGCVKKYLWNSKNFDIMGTETPEPGERQEDKCT